MDNILSFMILKLPSELLKEIAVKAQAHRKSKKISQQDLADRSGVSFGSIKRFETSGQISLESLLKVAFALDALDAFEQLFEPREAPKSLDELIKSQQKR